MKRKRTSYKIVGIGLYPKSKGKGTIKKTLYKKNGKLYVKIGKKYVRVKKK